MPLSKARDRERARERRKVAKLASNLMSDAVQPKIDALQSKSSPIKTSLNTTAPPCVQPKLPEWVAQPNRFLEAHLRVCPDYDPVIPRDHFDRCPYINPLLRPSVPGIA